MSPLFLGTFLVLVSVFNQNIKGLIYLSLVLITSVISYGISVIIKNPPLQNAGAICNLIDFPLVPTQFNVPNFNSVFISFTFMYLLLPMVVNDQVNYWLVGVIITLFAIDAYVKLNNYCTENKGILYGAVIGLTCGAMGYFILKMLFVSDRQSKSSSASCIKMAYLLQMSNPTRPDPTRSDPIRPGI
jgi:hypothetical protein